MSIRRRLGLDKRPVFLIDGSSFLYRGFYAYPDLKRSDGLATNAIFIVLRILMRLIREEEPAFVGFFLDGRGPTERNSIYPEYKANRPSMPEPLATQVEPLQQGVRLLGLPLHVPEGVEADDAIACLAARFKSERPVVIVGSDKDLKQCLDTNVFLWDPGTKKDKVTTLEDFQAETGLTPANWPDFQALVGDSSDNIPGVPGVGPKTAVKVMRDFPTLEAIRDHVAELPKAARKKIEPELDNIFVYRELTRLKTGCMADSALDDWAVRPVDTAKLQAFLDEYEFRSLAREAKALFGAAPAKAEPRPAPAGGEQLSLLAAPPKADAPLDARTARTPDDLPDLGGRAVGLVVGDAGLHLGVDGVEYFLPGPPAGAAERLARAEVLAAPDAKALFRADPAWREVPDRAWFDLSLAAYLLSPEERNYSFPRLRESLALEPDAEPVHPEAKGLAALALRAVMAGKLANARLDKLMETLETPLIRVLADMEEAGVAIDREAFASFLAEVEAGLESLTGEIHALAGEEFNIRSNQQMGKVLFENLGLKPAGKTSGGRPSTAQAALERLAGQHEIVEKILEYRKLEKLRSTYLSPLPGMVDARGRLHTTFNQTATATGRLSSSNPNLQNIPVRGKLGARMRACFTAAPGKLLACADYSQIELRVLAHFSKDPALLDAFAEDADIHARTAALIFDKDPADIAPDERRNAKTINFGLIYGMGPMKLARELHVPMNQAKEFIERYFAKLGGLKEFYDHVLHRAERDGYVTTWAGRRRLLPEINSRNQNLAAQAKRQAVNTVIQGSAADIIKLAMLKVHADQALLDLDARLILQVHDELILETPAPRAEQAGRRLAAIMQSVADLAVPLKMDMNIGRSWAEAH